MHRQFEGTPTADDLGLKGRLRALYERRTMAKDKSAERILAECRCVQITGAEVVPGDFRYHDSRQLDTFILWEVIDVDRKRLVCEVKTIDEDSPELSEYWDGEQTLVDGFNKFYRPDPSDRARVEKKGFASAYSPFSQVARHRHLTLKLNTFDLVDAVYGKLPAQEEGFFTKIGRWLLGY